MKKRLCRLCKDLLQESEEHVCSECQLMDDRLQYILERNREEGRKYLANTFNAILGSNEKKYERRQNTYVPPVGSLSHTPDRRVKIRRVESVSAHPKRRKSDSD